MYRIIVWRELKILFEYEFDGTREEAEAFALGAFYALSKKKPTGISVK